MTARVTVELPASLCHLAACPHVVAFDLPLPVTQRSLLDAVEARYPMLRGCLRDHATQQRRAFLRFFACAQDLSHQHPDEPLPEPVAAGREPFLIIGAVAGG